MELNFTVTLEEANIIMAGLGELQAKVSAPLITKLQQQAAPQIPTQDAVSQAVEKTNE